MQDPQKLKEMNLKNANLPNEEFAPKIAKALRITNQSGQPFKVPPNEESNIINFVDTKYKTEKLKKYNDQLGVPPNKATPLKPEQLKNSPKYKSSVNPLKESLEGPVYGPEPSPNDTLVKEQIQQNKKTPEQKPVERPILP